jgi:hypothetical protein
MKRVKRLGKKSVRHACASPVIGYVQLELTGESGSPVLKDKERKT